MERRTVLLGGGTMLATVAAGCLEDGERDEETMSATDAVERYFRAVADGDREEANQYAHPDGGFHIAAGDPLLDVRDLTIDETETVDIETGVRQMYEEPEAAPIDEIVEAEKAALEELREEYGFGEFAYVRHDAEAEGRSFNPIYVLFEDDGWVIWSVPTVHRSQ